MQIYYDPDEYKTETTYHKCPFHEAHPGVSFAGCTCSFGMMQVRRSPEEYKAVRDKRRRAEEDRILAEAEVIRARRAVEP